MNVPPTNDMLTVEMDVNIVDDHAEIRDVPLICPGCRADLLKPGAIDQFQWVPARRRGRLVVDATGYQATFEEDFPPNRWHQSEDRDNCPVAHYACAACDLTLSEPIYCACYEPTNNERNHP